MMTATLQFLATSPVEQKKRIKWPCNSLPYRKVSSAALYWRAALGGGAGSSRLSNGVTRCTTISYALLAHSCTGHTAYCTCNQGGQRRTGAQTCVLRVQHHSLSRVSIFSSSSLVTSMKFVIGRLCTLLHPSEASVPPYLFALSIG